MEILEVINKKYNNIQDVLNERAIRIWCATEAQAIGRGGVTLVHKATGVSRITITKGINELHCDDKLPKDQLRQKGVGRKKLTDQNHDILPTLEQLVTPATRGDPERALLWTSKSTYKLMDELLEQGHRLSQRSVYNLLSQQNYSLKSNKKTKEGTKNNPDRDQQFNFINQKIISFQTKGLPVLSVDAKKKENIGEFKNNGREWHKKGESTRVNTYDFTDKTKGKAAPYGIYDITNNIGWVSVGISSDTAEFAVSSIRSWWYEMGKEVYKDATEIMITADCGGSNGNKVRLWKYELQKLANELNKSITVCHLPPGTSKWNKIEHRMFCQITHNWRAKPLIDLRTIVELIGNTRTTTGLKIRSKLDDTIYQKGRVITNEELSKVNLVRDEFHGEWNYTIHPNIV